MLWIILGCSFSCLSVAAGAFGAHFLKASLSEYAINIFNTAVQYQMYHGLALVLLGIYRERQTMSEKLSGWCFVFGIILFSGSLYGLALTGIKWLGALTPIGGLLFLTGWLLFANYSFNNKREL
jgi:uncharacterized membrane protein YgdD (TMEM256/DUF423 family)